MVCLLWRSKRATDVPKDLRIDGPVGGQQTRAGARGAHLDWGYQRLDAKQLATGYLAMIDGLWLSLLVAPRSLTKKNAKHIAATYLIDAFSRHREELLGGDNRVV